MPNLDLCSGDVAQEQISQFGAWSAALLIETTAAFGSVDCGGVSQQSAGFGSVDFSRTDHAAVANAFGVKSYTVEDPAQLEGVLSEALNYNGPTLVDIMSQPLQEAAAPVSEWIA